MRPPQTPYNELDTKRWNDVWRWMRRTYAMLFFQHQFTGMVSYAGDPIYFERPTHDSNLRPANDNQRG